MEHSSVPGQQRYSRPALNAWVGRSLGYWEFAVMAYVDWSIEGPEYANCNCAWGCPCQFNALPTDGTCRAVAGMRIEQGHFGSTRLDGLAWVGTYGWPGPIHEGNGTQQFFIDERADADQRSVVAAGPTGPLYEAPRPRDRP